MEPNETRCFLCNSICIENDFQLEGCKFFDCSNCGTYGITWEAEDSAAIRERSLTRT